MKENYLIPIAASLLSFVGGFMEGYTYILRGEVFCSAQTGNIALMMVNFAQNNPFMWAHLTSLCAFACGVFVGNFAFLKKSSAFNIISRDKLLIFGIIVLTIICFIPPGVYNIWVSTSISFVSAVLYNSFRQIDEILYSSVFCTSNVRQAALSFFDYVIWGDKLAWIVCKKYIFVILFFILGVTISTMLSNFLGQYALFVVVLLLIILLVFDKIKLKKPNLQYK